MGPILYSGALGGSCLIGIPVMLEGILALAHPGSGVLAVVWLIGI